MTGEIQTAQVRRLFLIFSRRSDAKGWETILDAAVRQVTDQLKPDADASDPRLCYYAAALANLHYRTVIAANGAVSPTYAGAMPQNRKDSAPVSFAELLAERFRNDCADLLRDDSAMLIPT